MNNIHPTMPALNVHVGHMNVFVQEDKLKLENTAAAVLRDL